jgi:hypothetical protein
VIVGVLVGVDVGVMVGVGVDVGVNIWISISQIIVGVGVGVIVGVLVGVGVGVGVTNEPPLHCGDWAAPNIVDVKPVIVWLSVNVNVVPSTEYTSPPPLTTNIWLFLTYIPYPSLNPIVLEFQIVPFMVNSPI